MEVQLITALIAALSAGAGAFLTYLNNTQRNKKDLQSVVDDRVTSLITRLEEEIKRKDVQIERLEALVEDTRLIALQVIKELRKYDSDTADSFADSVNRL